MWGKGVSPILSNLASQNTFDVRLVGPFMFQDLNGRPHVKKFYPRTPNRLDLMRISSYPLVVCGCTGIAFPLSLKLKPISGAASPAPPYSRIDCVHARQLFCSVPHSTAVARSSTRAKPSNPANSRVSFLLVSLLTPSWTRSHALHPSKLNQKPSEFPVVAWPPSLGIL